MARSARSKRRRANNAIKREKLVKSEARRLAVVTAKLDEIIGTEKMNEDLTTQITLPKTKPKAVIKITSPVAMEVDLAGLGQPRPLVGIKKRPKKAVQKRLNRKKLS